MKAQIFILFLFCGLLQANATDPIKKRTLFIEVDLSYSFYHHYQQALFKKNGLALGGAISLGHSRLPVYLEYTYQNPLRFAYRNNEVQEHFQELGLRYNLNHLSYLIPYGLDPYIGAGLMRRRSSFVQHGIGDPSNSELLSQHQEIKTMYKLSAGIKMGNRNVILGLHYDYLPGGFDLPNSEGEALRIYNSMHVVSVRLGIRFYQVPGKRIKCPKFNTRQKRSLSF